MGCLRKAWLKFDSSIGSQSIESNKAELLTMLGLFTFSPVGYLYLNFTFVGIRLRLIS